MLVILYNMLCCIESLHQRGVMHRDVKPANMMINDDYDVALVDFGLSKISDGNQLYESVRNFLYEEQLVEPDQESKQKLSKVIK